MFEIFLVKTGIRGKHGFRIQPGLRTIQIGKSAASLFDDDSKCRNIENIDVRLDNRFDFSRREQMVMVKSLP